MGHPSFFYSPTSPNMTHVYINLALAPIPLILITNSKGSSGESWQSQDQNMWGVTHQRSGVLKTEGLKNWVSAVSIFYMATLYLLNSYFSRVKIRRASRWGVKENGSWNGMFGMLQKNEVDLFAGNIRMTSDRLDATNFLTPFFLVELVSQNYYYFQNSQVIMFHKVQCYLQHSNGDKEDSIDKC